MVDGGGEDGFRFEWPVLQPPQTHTLYSWGACDPGEADLPAPVTSQTPSSLGFTQQR